MYNLALARYLPDMLWRAELEFRNERDLLQEPGIDESLAGGTRTRVIICELPEL